MSSPEAEAEATGAGRGPRPVDGIATAAERPFVGGMLIAADAGFMSDKKAFSGNMA